MKRKKAYIIVFFAGILFGLLATAYLFSFAENEPIAISEGQALMMNDNYYFQTVHSLLSSSNKSIHMIMFSVNYYPDYPESLENFLLKDLIDAVDRGVDVKIVVDEYQTEKPVLTYLKKNGVDIKFDSKDRTTHSKLIIIDSKIVIIGSTNWSYYSIEKNHESNVVIHSEELAKSFEWYFNGIWSET